MKHDYCELDGERVVAILEKDCIPATRWIEPIEPGRIVGVATHEHLVMPTWLAEVLQCDGDVLRVVVKCMVGQAAAGDWYGPPFGKQGSPDADFAVGDVAPCNYDVYGVLPKSCEGPPVFVERRYVRIPRLRMFVPPPYRRGFCWYTEAKIAGVQ